MDMACPVPGPSKNISRVSILPAAVRSLYHKGSGRFPGPSGNKKRRFLAGFRKKMSVFPEGEKTAGGGLGFSGGREDFYPPSPYALKNKELSFSGKTFFSFYEIFMFLLLFLYFYLCFCVYFCNF